MIISETERPLILFTNDDGIESPGLWAAARAFAGLGDLLVAAPLEQQSGSSRSMPGSSRGGLFPFECPADVPDCTAFAVDGTPAQAVQFAVLELADRKPSLVISGINFGENTGNVVTLSGTVGAAIEAASLDIPALAVSQQIDDSAPNTCDFRAAAHFARFFGSRLLRNTTMPYDVDVVKVEIPLGATEASPWRLTRLSRLRIYWPQRPERAAYSDHAKLHYALRHQPASAEPDSDIYAVLYEGVVAVTPISLDMTSRTDRLILNQLFGIEPPPDDDPANPRQ